MSNEDKISLSLVKELALAGNEPEDEIKEMLEYMYDSNVVVYAYAVHPTKGLMLALKRRGE